MLRKLLAVMLISTTSIAIAGGSNIGTENSSSSNHFSGNYMGINIGHADSNSYSREIGYNDQKHHYSSTGLSSYNIMIGKNWMVSNSFLMGAEAALGYLDLNSSHVGTDVTGDNGRSLLRGGAHLDFALKAGFVRGNYMAYIKAGVVKTNLTHEHTDTVASGQTLASGTKSSSLKGELYGVGIERKINATTNFSLAFSRYDFDTASGVAAGSSNGTYPHHHETSVKTISVGLISKF
jgi:hypothetical protein